jgi:threonine dehydrogenase-like Zn-dependent dehydrogenase
MDTFPVGVIMNKGLTVRTGQQHGQHYVPRLLEHASRGEFPTSYLATHVMGLDEAVRGYEMFKTKEDGCVRSVFRP